jgi:hypothetical protein
MHRPTAQSALTWAEATALQRCTRSAAPGVGVDDRAGLDSGSVSLPAFHFNTNAKNLCGRTPRPLDRMSPPQLTNAGQSEFQFPLNQDTITPAH